MGEDDIVIREEEEGVLDWAGGTGRRGRHYIDRECPSKGKRGTSDYYWLTIPAGFATDPNLQIRASDPTEPPSRQPRSPKLREFVFISSSKMTPPSRSRLTTQPVPLIAVPRTTPQPCAPIQLASIPFEYLRNRAFVTPARTVPKMTEHRMSRIEDSHVHLS
jgi:hypothetical protein